MKSIDREFLQVLRAAIVQRARDYYGVGLPSEWKLLQNYEAEAIVCLALEGFDFRARRAAVEAHLEQAGVTL